MVGRVIEIATDGRHLAIDRGFMPSPRRAANSAASRSTILLPSSPMPTV